MALFTKSKLSEISYMLNDAHYMERLSKEMSGAAHAAVLELLDSLDGVTKKPARDAAFRAWKAKHDPSKLKSKPSAASAASDASAATAVTAAADMAKATAAEEMRKEISDTEAELAAEAPRKTYAKKTGRTGAGASPVSGRKRVRSRSPARRRARSAARYSGGSCVGTAACSTGIQ